MPKGHFLHSMTLWFKKVDTLVKAPPKLSFLEFESCTHQQPRSPENDKDNEENMFLKVKSWYWTNQTTNHIMTLQWFQTNWLSEKYSRQATRKRKSTSKQDLSWQPIINSISFWQRKRTAKAAPTLERQKKKYAEKIVNFQICKKCSILIFNAFKFGVNSFCPAVEGKQFENQVVCKFVNL